MIAYKHIHDYSLIYVIDVQEHPIPICLEEVEGIAPIF
jgi:hypothetical protein